MGVVNDSKKPPSLSRGSGTHPDSETGAGGACERAEDGVLVLFTTGGWPVDERQWFRE